MSGDVVALELTRIGAGFTPVGVCFAQLRAPSAVVMRAGRLTTLVRVAGLVAARTGRRRTADPLLACRSIASLALLAGNLRPSANPSRPTRV